MLRLLVVGVIIYLVVEKRLNYYNN